MNDGPSPIIDESLTNDEIEILYQLSSQLASMQRRNIFQNRINIKFVYQVKELLDVNSRILSEILRITNKTMDDDYKKTNERD